MSTLRELHSLLLIWARLPDDHFVQIPVEAVWRRRLLIRQLCVGGAVLLVSLAMSF